MAYTATVTKSSVSKADNYFNVSADVVINDGTNDIITSGVSARYSAGTSPNEVTARLSDAIQELWDNYIEEQAIFNSAALDTAIATLTTNLNTYIN